MSDQKTVPLEAMKVLSDALQEFKDITEDAFHLREFNLVLGTNSTDPSKDTQITVTLGDDDDFNLSFD